MTTAITTGFTKRTGKRGKRKGGQAAINAHAVRAVVQILTVTGKSYTIETLREKLREFFLEEADCEKRAVASLSALELMTALLEAAPGLECVGLKIRVLNGSAQLTTSRVENEKLREFLAQHVLPSEAGPYSQAATEVLACIAFKQQISQAEIDKLFNADKRHVVNVLRESGMVEEFAGPDGRLRFVTTEGFLQHFGIESPEELRAAGAQPVERWI